MLKIKINSLEAETSRFNGKIEELHHTMFKRRIQDVYAHVCEIFMVRYMAV